MILLTWARRLFAPPATHPTHQAPAGSRPVPESLEDRASSTIRPALSAPEAREGRPQRSTRAVRPDLGI